jgi:hypothetical protein
MFAEARHTRLLSAGECVQDHAPEGGCERIGTLSMAPLALGLRVRR